MLIQECVFEYNVAYLDETVVVPLVLRVWNGDLGLKFQERVTEG